MPNPITDLNVELGRVALFFEKNPEFESFKSALNQLINLATNDLSQSFISSLPRSKINWAPSLVNQIAKCLAKIKTEQDVPRILPQISLICEQYAKKEVSYPLLKVIGLICSTLAGLAIGAALGAVVGIGVLFMASAASFDPTGTSTSFLILAGSVLGGLVGAGFGAFGGYNLGTSLMDATFSDLSSTLFFQKEHLALSQAASEVAASMKIQGKTLSL